MQKLARVSSKGQVVIPAGIRKKHHISKRVLIREDNGKIILEPAKSFEESFGDVGETARKAAIEISIERRKEVESKRKKLTI